ncbi:hypothetical protein F511_08725 [Dorcoceras hygrometricum]|uniref:Uncharacterized protein n=1 Tax=Dorcoceras hygrometricum TaxID=472368 RepID=A0A2Z7A319_9LAMI|nr:hypothetical protein F511_08725 [Dorcoceras hygrometricum]
MLATADCIFCLALRLIHIFFTTETVITAGLHVRVAVHVGLHVREAVHIHHHLSGKGILLDRKCNIVELEEVREPTEIPSESPAPQGPVLDMDTPRRSERVSGSPVRYGFLLEDDQSDQTVGCDPRTFKEELLLAVFNDKACT